jgi:hypothetical protein
MWSEVSILVWPIQPRLWLTLLWWITRLHTVFVLCAFTTWDPGVNPLSCTWWRSYVHGRQWHFHSQHRGDGEVGVTLSARVWSHSCIRWKLAWGGWNGWIVSLILGTIGWGKLYGGDWMTRAMDGWLCNHANENAGIHWLTDQHDARPLRSLRD